MAEFLNPFSQMNADRTLTKQEIIRILRQDIATEHEAASLYEAHAEMIDDMRIKKVLLDIANEERVHVGEFQKLIKMLDDQEQGFLDDGEKEVEEIVKEMEPKGEKDKDILKISSMI